VKKNAIINKDINRRKFLSFAGATAAGAILSGFTGDLRSTFAQDDSRAAVKPNFIVIFCDDLGYGDVGCFGSNKHRTPNIDRMAAEGYATACVGKWHLGDQSEFLPTRQGFDYYYGIPYSNDMGKTTYPKANLPPLPLLRNEQVIEPDQAQITKRYTEETIKFIKANRKKPFFIYLPHTMSHNPVHSSDRFRGKSANDGYGDAVEEIDWSTGEILAALEALDIDDRTLVVFTSDNGAAQLCGGSNLPLSGFKGSTMEGGMREPCVMRWPGRIPAGRACDELASTLDLLPTLARLAGTKAPDDRIIDGKDIWPLMAGREGAKSQHEAFYYYQMDQLQAVRSGRWKLHLPLKVKKRILQESIPDSPPLLYDLEADIGEKNDVADRHPDVVERLLGLARKAREDLGDVNYKGRQRPAGWVVTPTPLMKEKI